MTFADGFWFRMGALAAELVAWMLGALGVLGLVVLAVVVGIWLEGWLRSSRGERQWPPR